MAKLSVLELVLLFHSAPSLSAFDLHERNVPMEYFSILGEVKLTVGFNVDRFHSAKPRSMIVS